MSTREDFLAEIKAKREREKQQERNKSSFIPREYEEINYCVIPETENNYALVRILGGYKLNRESGSSPKDIYIARILCDDDKLRKFVFPEPSQKDYLFYKIYNLVTKYKYNNETKSKDYVYSEGKYKQVFEKVFRNASSNNYDKGWKPLGYTVMNVIDRLDPDFHKNFKHSKVLTKKATEVKESNIVYYEPGVPIGLYNAIFDDLVDGYSDDYTNFDVFIKRDPTNQFMPYKVYHAVEDSKKIKDKSLLDKISNGVLTEEEKKYQLYDFDKIYRISTYHKWFKYLGKTIKEIDLKFNTNYYEELEKLNIEEEKMFKELYGGDYNPNNPEISKKDDKEINKDTGSLQDEIDKTMQNKNENVRQPKQKSFDLESYKCYNKLNKEEKEYIKSVDNEGKFVFEDMDDLGKCSGCNELFPNQFMTCPYCGEYYGE